MKSLLALLTILFVSCFSMAQNEVSFPTRLEDSGGWSYWLARKLVLDIDETLKIQGINAQVCTYRNLKPLQDFSYKGIGPCLFESFKKSMKTHELVGVVYTWIQDKNGKSHAIEIRWRPPRGGWLKVIDQVLEMKFERLRYKTRSFLGGEEFANRLRYSEFLVGELNILLPQDPNALAALVASGNQWLAKYAQGVREIDFKLKPTDVQEGKVVYQGQLSLGMNSEEGNADTRFEIKTNINVMILDRKFFVKGRVETAGGIPTHLPKDVLP